MPPAISVRLQTPEKIGAYEWSKKYRRVTDGNSKGPWREDLAPYSVKILKTYSKPWTREVWFVGVDQSGKTNSMLSCMSWLVDVAPGDIYYLMPTEATSQNVVSGKLRPTLKETPRLKKYFPKKDDDASLSKIVLNHGVTIRPAWANSPAAMATFSAKAVFGDEVDKYPRMAGKEATPIELLRKRNRTYRGEGKAFFSSTPGEGRHICKGVQKCQQIWEARVICPECKIQIRMDAEHLVFPDGEDQEAVERGAVRYACNSCGVEWGEDERIEAIGMAKKQGREWECTKGEDLTRAATVGFWHRAWECIDVTLSQTAAKYLAAKQGGTAEKTAWANGYEAEDFKEDKLPTVDVDGLLAFRGEYPRSIVPRDTFRLCLMVDTQHKSFYYQIWAYGYAPLIDMHMIRHGEVPEFADLEALLNMQFEDEKGKLYRIAGGLIDSGGTRMGWEKHSRTTEVYEWCNRNRTMIPIKGMHGKRGETVTYKDVPLYRKLRRANIRVDFFKDELERKLNMEPDDPGALVFHEDIETTFAIHYTAEYKDDTGSWQHNKKIRNDHFDCTVYALANRLMMEPHIPRKQKPVREAGEPPAQNQDRPRPKWLDGRR